MYAEEPASRLHAHRQQRPGGRPHGQAGTEAPAPERRGLQTAEPADAPDHHSQGRSSSSSATITARATASTTATSTTTTPATSTVTTSTAIITTTTSTFYYYDYCHFYNIYSMLVYYPCYC